MKFRRKPDTTTIEAVQWFPEVQLDFVTIEDPPNDMLVKGEPPRPAIVRAYVITAQKQRAYLTPGDWIITEPDGVNHYPCKADIFEARYEPAE